MIILRYSTLHTIQTVRSADARGRLSSVRDSAAIVGTRNPIDRVLSNSGWGAGVTGRLQIVVEGEGDMVSYTRVPDYHNYYAITKYITVGPGQHVRAIIAYLMIYPCSGLDASEVDKDYNTYL